MLWVYWGILRGCTLATCFCFSVGLREDGLGYEVYGGVLWVVVVVLSAVSLRLVERWWRWERCCAFRYRELGLDFATCVLL